MSAPWIWAVNRDDRRESWIRESEPWIVNPWIVNPWWSPWISESCESYGNPKPPCLFREPWICSNHLAIWILLEPVEPIRNQCHAVSDYTMFEFLRLDVAREITNTFCFSRAVIRDRSLCPVGYSKRGTGILVGGQSHFPHNFRSQRPITRVRLGQLGLRLSAIGLSANRLTLTKRGNHCSEIYKTIQIVYSYLASERIRFCQTICMRALYSPRIRTQCCRGKHRFPIPWSVSYRFWKVDFWTFVKSMLMETDKLVHKNKSKIKVHFFKKIQEFLRNKSFF